MTIADNPLNPSNASHNTIVPSELLSRQRGFFALGYTRDLDYRLRRLQELRAAIAESEPAINAALQADLGKPGLESYATEIGFCLAELDYTLQHLAQWMKPRRVKLPKTLFPASGHIQPEPLGVVLILGAWNYPLQLTLGPLIGAIAAGNCAIIKPSEIAPHTSQVVAELIARTFDPMYVAVVEGGANTSQALLAERFDHIFFTGGPTIAKVVMANAARHLTPVTLELGGKSPCIVDETADLDQAARRITWGKFVNAGQTCLAPDYLLVARSVKADLVGRMARTIAEFYGSDPATSPDYGRIVHERHVERLAALMASGRAIVGGQVDRDRRYVAPTLLDDVGWDAPIMQEEIFGPILPILAIDDLDSAIAQINARPKPLAVYLFSKDKANQAYVLRETASGTAAINDVVLQCGAPQLPFGGVGPSGMGRYHGKYSFDTFSHEKSILHQTSLFDAPLRYPPYTAKKLGWFKRLMGG